jgi:hypothetical protein
MERFSFRELNEAGMETFNLKVERKEQYHVEVSARFAALENLDAEVDINSNREIMKRE